MNKLHCNRNVRKNQIINPARQEKKRLLRETGVTGKALRKQMKSIRRKNAVVS